MLQRFKNNMLQYFLITILSLYFTTAISWSAFSHFYFISFVVVFLIVFLILNFLFPKLSDFKIINNNKKIKKKEFLLYALLLIVVFIFSFFVHYPAITSGDTTWQWEQVKWNGYSNWHPVVHTFIFMRIPYLFYNGFESCSIFQMIFIGIILLYFCYFLRKYFLSFKQTILVLLLIILNPSFISMSMTIWKDVPYSWSIFLGTILIMEIVLTKGLWLKNHFNKAIFILTLLGIMLIRHNGIALIIIILLFLMIIYRDKIKFLLVTLLLLVGFRFALYGPIYEHLNIDTNIRNSETLGVVSAQISYMYHNDLISKKDEKILLEWAPKSDWEKKYNPVNFNTMKWDIPGYWDWADKNYNKILDIWIKLAFKYPKAFVTEYLNITSPIWMIEDNLQFDKSFAKYNSNTSYMKLFKNVYNNYSDIISKSLLKYLFFNIGLSLFIIVLSLFIIIYKARHNYEYYLPFVLVLSNTLVIMCLITGEEYRFVYSQIICSVPLLIYALCLPKPNTKTKTIINKNNNYIKKIYKKLFTNPSDNSLLQFIRYGFVGGIAAIVNIGMLYIFTDLFHIYYIASNIISFILGLIVNYVLSKKLVFTKKVNISKYSEFSIYAIIGVIGLLFDTILLWLFTDIFKIFYLLSKLFSTFIVFVWNFGARKLLYKIVK